MAGTDERIGNTVAETDRRSELARDLDTLRRQAGLSYRELARLSGCPTSTLNDALRGRRFPRLDTVLAVARACGAGHAEWRRRWIEADQAAPAVPSEPPAARTAGPDVPAQLPADIQTFTARAAELEQIVTGAGSGVVVLSGPAGVGKTTLAVHVAHRIAGRYGDGQLFVDLHGFTPGMAPAAPADALARMLRALDVRDADMPEDLDERAAQFRSRIAGRRMLVVLDNASSVGQVRPLLPGSTDALVLVTGRQHLAGLAVTHDARLVTLEPLQPADAVLLLERIVGDRVTDEAEATRELVRSCGYLPLALRIAAAQLVSQPRLAIRQLADRLASGDRLGSLELSGDEFGGVRAAFERSYAALDAEARRLYRLLGLAPGLDFTLPVAAALLDSPVEYADTLLQRLVTAHLIQQRAARYRLHDLLRDDARTRSAAEDGEPDRDAAVRRVLQWYLHTVTATNRVLTPYQRAVPLDPAPESVPPLRFGTEVEALAWLDAERGNVFEAIRLAADHHGELCWKLTAMMCADFDRRGYWSDWATANDTALRAASRIGDDIGSAWILMNIGWAHFDRREFDRATERFRQAAELRDRHGDRAGLVRSLDSLASAMSKCGQGEAALTHSLAALEIRRELGDRDGLACTLLNLGNYFRAAGRYDEALSYLDQALALEREPGRGASEALVMGTIGEVMQSKRQHMTAVEWLERAVAVARRDRTAPREHGLVLAAYGQVLLDAGRPAAARRKWSGALEIFDELRDPKAEDVRKQLARLSSGSTPY